MGQIVEEQKPNNEDQKDNEQKFVSLLENLFDIVYANAMSMIELGEDMSF